MGALGVSPFLNDNALDWVWNLEAAEDFSVLSEALDFVASQDEIIEDGEEAIAAAEVVAALRGHPLSELPDEVSEFLKKHGKKNPSTALVKLAIAVVRRIAEESHLKSSWQEAGSAEAWLATTTDLLKRLSK